MDVEVSKEGEDDVTSTSIANVVGELVRKRQDWHLADGATPTTSKDALMLGDVDATSTLHERDLLGLVECMLPVLFVEVCETLDGCFWWQKTGTNVDVEIGSSEGGSIGDLFADRRKASWAWDCICKAVKRIESGCKWCRDCWNAGRNCSC